MSGKCTVLTLLLEEGAFKVSPILPLLRIEKIAGELAISENLARLIILMEINFASD